MRKALSRTAFSDRFATNFEFQLSGGGLQTMCPKNSRSDKALLAVSHGSTHVQAKIIAKRSTRRRPTRSVKDSFFVRVLRTKQEAKTQRRTTRRGTKKHGTRRHSLLDLQEEKRTILSLFSDHHQSLRLKLLTLEVQLPQKEQDSAGVDKREGRPHCCLSESFDRYNQLI